MRTKVAQVLQHASEQVSSLEQALRQLSVSPNSMHALMRHMPHSLGINAACCNFDLPPAWHYVSVSASGVYICPV